MVRRNAGKLLDFLLFVAVTLVSLAVGFAVINGTLTVPNVPSGVLRFSGWVVVISGIWAGILQLMNMFK
mgnify:CR=1 FL=1